MGERDAGFAGRREIIAGRWILHSLIAGYEVERGLRAEAEVEVEVAECIGP